MDFSRALEYLKAGNRARRASWPTPGLRVALRKGYPNGVVANEGTVTDLKVPAGSLVVIQPYFVTYCPDGPIEPWSPTHGDLLAEDWRVMVEFEQTGT